jgi:CHC2-type zinc finger protein
MITPRIVYPGNGRGPSGVSSSGDPASPHDFKRLLEAVKEWVPVIDVADLLCGPAGNRSGWRQVGDQWVARCPLPDHRCPWSFSFTVSKNENRWYCSECRVGGDVLDLYAYAGRYTDKAKALTDLARERGVRP